MRISFLPKRRHRTLLLLIGAISRCLFISYPSSIVFDENHYVRFITMYFKEETVIDVHPPLGRLLLYLIVKYVLRVSPDESVYDDTVYIGKTYYNTFLSGGYATLRTLSALVSCVSTVAGYEILSELGLKKKKAFLCSLLLLTEGTMHSIFRLFMVDSYVLSSISLILLSLVKMNKFSRRILYRPEKDSKVQCVTKIRFNIKDSHSEESVCKDKQPHTKTANICTNSIKDRNILGKHRIRVEQKEEQKKQKEPLILQSEGPLYIKSFLWACILSVFLGLGASIKWAVLPMGAPIGIYLLTDLIRSKRRRASVKRLLLPIAQGVAILGISFAIYVSVFIANCQVQNRYTEKTNFWYSFSYNASLRDSPYSAYKRVPLSADAPFHIADQSTNNSLVISNGSLSFIKGLPEDIQWTVEPANLDSAIGHSTPVYIRHASGLYIHSESDSFLSDHPDALFLENTDSSGVLVKNRENQYLNLQDRKGGKWSHIPHSFLFLYAPPDGNIRRHTQTDRHPVYSSVVYPATYLRMLAENTKVIFQCNSTLTGQHMYKSSPGMWPYKPTAIHLWSGAVAETHPDAEGKEVTAQMFLVQNPVILWLSLLSLFLYAGLILTTEVKNTLAHILVLSAYLSNYLPYFFLTRDTYTHHYIPSYYVSILVLGYIIGKTDRKYIFIGAVCATAGGCFLGQAPLLLGRKLSYERCRASFGYAEPPGVCELFDSIFE